MIDEVIEPGSKQNSIAVNPSKRAIQIMIFDAGEESIIRALGSLQLAADVVKNEFSNWHQRDREKNTIYVPKKPGS